MKIVIGHCYASLPFCLKTKDTIVWEYHFEICKYLLGCRSKGLCDTWTWSSTWVLQALCLAEVAGCTASCIY